MMVPRKNRSYQMITLSRNKAHVECCQAIFQKDSKVFQSYYEVFRLIDIILNS